MAEPPTTFADFSEMTRGELVGFLSVRGLSTKGCREEVVARAFSAYENNCAIVINKAKREAFLRDEYVKLVNLLGITDPFENSPDSWSNDVSLLPPIDIGKIFHFLLENREFNTDYVGKYKTQKAYSYLKSKFVGQIMIKASCNNNCIIKCEVKRSQKMQAEPAKVWIVLNENGESLGAWCTCTAGYGKTCNHIVAVLYKAEECFSSFLASPSCTDVASAYNSTHRQIEPMKICEMDFRRDRLEGGGATPEERLSSREKKNAFDPRMAKHQRISPEEICDFLVALKPISPNAVLFTAVKGQLCEKTKLPTTLTNLGEKMAQDEVIDPRQFVESAMLSRAEIDAVEVATREQHTSSVWTDQRRGRVTASNVHDVIAKINAKINAKREYVSISPVVEKIITGGINLDHVPAVKWGVSNEPHALEYCQSLFQDHTDGKVRKCGLFIHEQLPYLAASPDGLLECNCCGKVPIEIKCPYSLRDIVEEGQLSEASFLESNHGRFSLKENHKYFAQVQCQIAVLKSQFAFFVVWTPKVCISFKVPKLVSKCSEIEKAASLFFKDYLSKYLLKVQALCYCPLCEKLLLEEGEFNDPAKNSVECDSCLLWFHWGCVGFDGEGSDNDFICTLCKKK
jgi:hypothetical protein